MTRAELERWTKKILKLISFEGKAVLCNFKSMSIAEWDSWRRNVNNDDEAFFGFPVTQDYECLIRVCEALLLRMNLRQWAPKHTLSAIYERSNDEIKGKFNSLYLFMENSGEIPSEDPDVPTILVGFLESWIQGSKFVIQKQNLGPEMINNQRISLPALQIWRTYLYKYWLDRCS